MMWEQYKGKGKENFICRNVFSFYIFLGYFVYCGLFRLFCIDKEIKIYRFMGFMQLFKGRSSLDLDRFYFLVYFFIDLSCYFKFYCLV